MLQNMEKGTFSQRLKNTTRKWLAEKIGEPFHPDLGFLDKPSFKPPIY